MGSDAKAQIWVGVRAQDCDLDEFKETLPKDFFNEDGDFYWEYGSAGKALLEKYGFLLEEFVCSDECVGIGIEVLDHDWDDSPEQFNIMKVSSDIEVARHNLIKLLNGNDKGYPIGTWITADYS